MARSRKKPAKKSPPPRKSAAPVPVTSGSLPAGYTALLNDLKTRIRTAQIKASLAVNRELILLYWHIGRELTLRQEQAGWVKR